MMIFSSFRKPLCKKFWLSVLRRACKWQKSPVFKYRYPGVQNHIGPRSNSHSKVSKPIKASRFIVQMTYKFRVEKNPRIFTFFIQKE